MTRQAATRPFGNDLTSQAAATMKAVRAYARGGPEQIVFGDVRCQDRGQRTRSCEFTPPPSPPRSCAGLLPQERTARGEAEVAVC
jgi:hypothetical protein